MSESCLCCGEPVVNDAEGMNFLENIHDDCLAKLQATLARRTELLRETMLDGGSRFCVCDALGETCWTCRVDAELKRKT